MWIQIIENFEFMFVKALEIVVWKLMLIAKNWMKNGGF